MVQQVFKICYLFRSRRNVYPCIFRRNLTKKSNKLEKGMISSPWFGDQRIRFSTFRNMYVSRCSIEYVSAWFDNIAIFCDAIRYVLWCHPLCFVMPSAMFCDAIRYVLWCHPLCFVMPSAMFCDAIRYVLWCHPLCFVMPSAMFCDAIRYVLWCHPLCYGALDPIP